MKVIKKTVLYKTPFLNLIEVIYKDFDGRLKSWYGAERTTAETAIAVAAITKRKELILVRQFRPLLNASTIELPAGLSDIDGEGVVETAARELLEETGYKAEQYQTLVGYNKGSTISSGLTNERLVLVSCRDAVKVAEPLQNEGTVPLLVPLAKINEWLDVRTSDEEVDFKLFGAVRIVTEWYEKER